MAKAVIKILQPGDEPMLEAFLLPRVESSMFLIGNMRASGLTDRGTPYEGTYAAAFERGEIVSVAAHYWNGNLVFQAPVHLAEVWTAAVEASGRPVKGLIGPADQVGRVFEALDIAGADVQLDETEKLYRLSLAELVVPVRLRSGAVTGRRIEAGDIDLLTKWQVAFDVEALGAADNAQLRAERRASVQRSMAEGRTWILEERGRPVACSSFNTAIKEAVQAGGVWTPPALRRRGYGRAVVAQSLLDARADGATTAILFTGKENVAAQRAYEALGFEQIGSYRLLLLKTSLEPGVYKEDSEDGPRSSKN